MPLVSILRSKLFVGIVSLIVLTGYGSGLFGDCCGQKEQGQVELGKSVPHDQTADTGDNCQCVCHQSIAWLASATLRIADADFVPTVFLANTDEFPPDSLPLGIDHPPQLA